MKPDWWPGEVHDSFTNWAISNGVIANGVTPARFPGRGLGMISTRKIKKGEAMVEVPTEVMLTANDIPAAFVERFPEDIAVHALLAAFLTHGRAEDLAKYELWRNTWPSRQDFEESMPILWPSALGGPKWPDHDGNGNNGGPSSPSAQPNFLPPSISGSWNTFQKKHASKEYETYHQNLLALQETRLLKAWTDVVSVFPDTDWRTFSYHWLIINTRSFYWLGAGQDRPEDRNDAMALLPFADYFNHADVACDVNFNKEGYVFRAARDYEEGEEVFMSYGKHPNDFLLTEYGFFLHVNGDDSIYLDDIVFREIPSPLKQEELWMNQYYGNYQVTRHGVCFRTEVAACMKYMDEVDWRNHLLEGSSRALDERKSEAIIRDWIRMYGKEADAVMAALRTAMASSAWIKAHRQKAEMLLRRWEQIKNLCESAVEAVSV